MPNHDYTRQVPLESHPHAGTWLAWPAHFDLWQDAMPAVRSEVAALTRQIAAGERIFMLAATAEAEDDARSTLAGLDVVFHRVLYGDIWMRDTLPVFTTQADGSVQAQRFIFDGWGQKYDLPGDRSVGDAVASLSGHTLRTHNFVLEGGSVEFDGQGTVITTRQCLLDGVRNPGWTESSAEDALKEAFGVRKVIWVDQGLHNDHTDGHIDTLVRFVSPGRVVCMAPSGPDDPNAAVLRAIQASLKGQKDASGRTLEVLTLPSPGRILDPDGRLMPASHVNFYIANAAVILPLYGTVHDASALSALSRCFSDRPVVGLSARAILEGGGAFHCITQQVPVFGGAL